MTHYKQGDVVLIRFPYTDLTNIKRRPAFIVSSNWYNDIRQDVIVLAISSQISEKLKRDEFLIDSKRDLHASRLPKPSVIKLGKVMTLHRDSIIKSFGRLPEDTTRKIIKRYFDVLGQPDYV